MHTISAKVACKRCSYTNEPAYYTGVVTYWRRREVLIFLRSFVLEARAHAWADAKRKELHMYGPEPMQAAE